MNETNPPSSNPFVGPRALQTGEKLFGRDREVHQLLSLLIAERIVLLHSPSGAGKSSLVQAGLAPRLAEEGFRVLPLVRVGLELPAALKGGNGAPSANRYIYSTLVSLQEAALERQDAAGVLPEAEVQPAAPTPPGAPAPTPEELASTTLAAYVAARFPQGQGEDANRVILFDQFEEVLTVDPGGQAEKAAFFAQLGELLLDRGLWALFVMREDYVAALAPYLRPLPTRLNSRYRLDLLSAEAARQAIQKPCAEAGVEFTGPAAWQLVDDLRRVQVQRPDGSLETRLGPYVEPMQLQVVGYRLWEQRKPGDRQITTEDLAAIGSVDRALSDYYALRVGEAAAQTGVPERAIRAWVERRLITESGIRGQVVMGVGETAGLDNRAVRLLQNAHLIRAEQRGGATWFELAHDRLIQPVRENNAEWFERHLSLLQRQAELWDGQQRPQGLLFEDPLLTQAEAWAREHDAELTPCERDFLKACADLREQARQTRTLNRRVRALAVVSSLAFVLALLLAGLAWNSYRDANRLRVQAEQASSTAVAGHAVALTQESRAVAGEHAAQANAIVAEQNAALAEMSAAEAEKSAGEARTMAATAEAARAIANARQLKAQAAALLDQQYDLALLLAVESERGSLAGGGPVADGSDHVLVQALEHNPRLVTYLHGHTAPVTSLALNRDGTRMVSGDQSGGLILWDLAADPPTARPLPAHGFPVLRLRFSPNGATFVSAAYSLEGVGADGAAAEARQWDARSGEMIRALSIDQLPGADLVAISNDASTLAVDTAEGVAFWNVSADRVSGKTITAGEILGQAPATHTYYSYDYAANDLAFLPGDRQLALSFANSVLLYDVRSGERGSAPGQPLHANTLVSIAAAPTGPWVATASYDGTTRLWNRQTDQVEWLPESASWYYTVHSHSYYIKRGMAFHPTQPILALGGPDGAVTLWDTSKGTVIAEFKDRSAEVLSLEYSQDGQFFAAGGLDNTILLYRTAEGSRLGQPLPGYNDLVQNVTFSPDGRLMAVSDRLVDTHVVLMDAVTHKVLNRFQLGRQVMAVRFDGSSQRLMVADYGAGVVIWDTRTYQELDRMDADPMNIVAIDPAFKTLALAGKGQLKLVLYDVATHTYLPDLNLPALSMDFSPDGKRLAVLGPQGELNVLDTATWKTLFTANTGQPSLVAATAFSPDGKWLAAGSSSVLLWDGQTGESLGVLSDRHPAIRRLAFRPDGSMVALGCEDGQILLFDPRTRERLGSLPSGFVSGVQSLSFHPNLPLLASTGYDSNKPLLLWDLDWSRAACLVANRSLTEEEWARFIVGQPYQVTCPVEEKPLPLVVPTLDKLPIFKTTREAHPPASSTKTP